LKEKKEGENKSKKSNFHAQMKIKNQLQTEFSPEVENKI